MSIATELTNLQSDITNARTAITNKGGTVTSGGGSSQLATDIATIPTQGALKTISPTVNGKYKVNEDLEIYDTMTLTGNAYANTDFTPPDNSIEEFEACFVVTALVTGTNRNRIFGAQGTVTQNNNKYTLMQTPSGFSFITNGDNYVVAITPVIGTEYICKFNGSIFTVNDVVGTSTAESQCLTPVTLDIFACHAEDDTHIDKFTGIFKYLKFSDKIWYVPAKLNGNPAICNKITGEAYALVGSGVTMGTKLSEESYTGFASPMVVNVANLYQGASGEDLFPDTITNHTIKIHGTPSANLYDRMFARKRGGYSDIIFTGTDISANSFQYFAYYGNIKSFSADNVTRFTAGRELYFFANYCTTIKKLSFKNLTTLGGTYGFYYACSLSEVGTNLEEIDFSSLQTITGSMAFANAFQYCRGLYPNKVAHPFPALETVSSNTSVFAYVFRYGRATMYVFDKLTNIETVNTGSNQFLYAFDGNIWDLRSGDTEGRKCGAAFPLVTQVGYNSTGVYSACKYLFQNGTNGRSLYMTSLETIYNNSTTNTNGHFAYCDADFIYMPKLTVMGNKSEYVFTNSTRTTELHFGIENQATIEAMTGYSSKFGATAATIYFDLANHLTIDGVVYDRDGNTDDYDEWYFGFTNGSTTYYIDNYTGNVGDTVYTKSDDTYTATALTVTAIA